MRHSVSAYVRLVHRPIHIHKRLLAHILGQVSRCLQTLVDMEYNHPSRHYSRRPGAQYSYDCGGLNCCALRKPCRHESVSPACSFREHSLGEIGRCVLPSSGVKISFPGFGRIYSSRAHVYSARPFAGIMLIPRRLVSQSCGSKFNALKSHPSHCWTSVHCALRPSKLCAAAEIHNIPNPSPQLLYGAELRQG